MTLLLATQLLQVLAAMLAVLLAARRAEHRPCAVLLVFGALANTVRTVLQQIVVLPAVIVLGGDPASGIAPVAPLTGWARAAAHVNHALLLGWSAAVAMTALAVFGALARMEPAVSEPSVNRRFRVVMGATLGPAVAWAAIVAYLVATYPDSRPMHRQGYLLADLLAIAVGLVAFASWLRRRDVADGLSVTRLCVLCVLALDGVALLGPHLVPGFFEGWDRAAAVYALLYAILSIVQGVFLCLPKTSL